MTTPRTPEEMRQIVAGRNRLKKFRKGRDGGKESPKTGSPLGHQPTSLESSPRWRTPFGPADDGGGPFSPERSRPPSANMSVSSQPSTHDGGHSAVQTPAQNHSTKNANGVTTHGHTDSNHHGTNGLTSPMPSHQDLAARLRAEMQRSDQFEVALKAAQESLNRERSAAQAAAISAAQAAANATARLQAKLSQKEAEIAHAAQNGRVNDETTSADRHALTTLHQQLAHTQSELSSLQGYVSQVTSEKDMLLEQKNSRERIVAKAREETAALQSKLEAAGHEKERLAAQIDMLRAEKEDQFAVLDEMSHKVEVQGELVDTVQRLQNERDDAVAHAEKFRDNLERAHQEVQKLQGALESSQAETRKCLDKLEQNEAALVAAQNVAQQAEAEKTRFFTEESDRRSELVEKARADAMIIERATAQNTELKARLFELEDRFVVISNERMVLTNEVDSLKHALQGDRDTSVVTDPGRIESNQASPAANASGGPSGQDLVDSLYLQIKQLEMERDELLAHRALTESTLEDSRRQSSASEAPADLPDLPDGTAPTGSAVTEVRVAKLEVELAAAQEEVESLHSRIRHLSDMNSDLTQRLRKEEGLTTQLAKETEKIPELIIIYQQQRQALDAKMQEQEELLRRAYKAMGTTSVAFAQSTDTNATTTTATPTQMPRKPVNRVRIPTPELVEQPQSTTVQPAYIWGEDATTDEPEERPGRIPSKAQQLAEQHRKVVENPWPRHTGIFVL